MFGSVCSGQLGLKKEPAHQGQMSQKSAVSPQRSSSTEIPARTTAFSIDDVDVEEQELIQSRLAEQLEC